MHPSHPSLRGTKQSLRRKADNIAVSNIIVSYRIKPILWFLNEAAVFTLLPIKETRFYMSA